MEEIMLRIENVSKQYKLGQIGGTTLHDELQRARAKRKGLEDPTKLIGTKDYNKGETFMALDGVSFEVKKGERVGIIGHNGAGKSTLLKLISRVTAPTTGTISMNGRVASMLEVGTGFHGELTGRENIYMNGAILGMTKKEIDAKIEDIIDFSEVREFIDTPVKRYSSGMYVKLAFSVAAHLDSEIMIMDEVLAVGDMAFQKKCLDKMSDVSKTEGRTILYVSHNMNTIRQLCDRCIVLDHGKVVFNGDVEEAIGVYIGSNSNELPSYYDLEVSERPSSQHGYDIHLKHIRFIGKQMASFAQNEEVCFEIFFESRRDIADLKIYAIISSLGGTSIGMTHSEAFVSTQIGKEYKQVFSFNANILAQGRYVMEIDLFSNDDIGNHWSYDHPMQSIAFEIQDASNDAPRWHKNFGWVKFDLLKAKES